MLYYVWRSSNPADASTHRSRPDAEQALHRALRLETDPDVEYCLLKKTPAGLITLKTRHLIEIVESR